MAKVINPLLSGVASGQFGHMMTFDKRGFVRKYVEPANPQSEAQVAVRDKMGDVQRCIKQMGTDLREALASGLGYRWNSMIASEALADDAAFWLARDSEWDAFSGANQGEWADADPGLGYKTTDGEVLYIVAYAVYTLSLRVMGTAAITEPAEANFATVAGEWIAST
jgi:hypothetical protein